MENTTSIHNISSLYSIFLVRIYMVILTFIYPFYIHVYRMNREWDQKTALYHIIRHSYKVLQKFYVLLYIFIATTIITDNFYKDNNTVWFLYYLYFMSQFLILYLMAEVNHFLLCLLAFQRFMIYFFPWSEKYIRFDETGMSRFVICCYIIFGLQLTWELGISHNQCFFYIIINFLLLLSILLYLPIAYSIQKTYIPLYFSFASEDLELLVGSYKVIDSFLTPFIVQISYLGCNRRNLMTLLWSLKPKNVLKTLCCPCFTAAPRVAPRDQSMYSSSGLPLY
ncbi:hypothetical protein CAEBREN_25181 [Caenorhabditis brenneri]|uniref:Serpentine Receptor, class Z n=1 Tax=Caenorhabditis brenneri TaxID=135651 RepID=G0N346_CAEBE|nr:hypothetical protein CAEBREN_25181 [Caenorhabditis brenneri]